jgi:hypothetical protein
VGGGGESDRGGREIKRFRERKRSERKRLKKERARGERGKKLCFCFFVFFATTPKFPLLY